MQNGKERIDLQLESPDETDSIGEILDAEKIWIEKEKSSQKEFGTICLEAISEYTTTIYFDSIREIKKAQPGSPYNSGQSLRD